MRRPWSLISTGLIVMVLMVVACGGDEPTVALDQDPPEVAELSPEELGELGVRLEDNPDQIEEILAEHGMTIDTYEAAIRRLTENPGEAKRYADAYENARG